MSDRVVLYSCIVQKFSKVEGERGGAVGLGAKALEEEGGGSCM